MTYRRNIYDIIDSLGGSKMFRLENENRIPTEFSREDIRPMSVPIEGTMYSAGILVLDEGTFFIKTLRPDVTQRFRGVANTLGDFFTQQEQTHQLVHSYLTGNDANYMLPSRFVTIDEGNETTFHIVQPMVTGAVQYKQFRNTQQTLPKNYLPPFQERVDFASRLGDLQNGTRKLLDLDFFIVGVPEPGIVVFDATWMWYDKREGKDKAEQGYHLSQFLFPDGEQVSEDQRQIILNVRKHLIN